MSKYEVIQKIMHNPNVDEDVKVDAIEMFLKGWLTESDLSWLCKED
jgi:hypothetical protein